MFRGTPGGRPPPSPNHSAACCGVYISVCQLWRPDPGQLAEERLQVYGVAEELGSAHITPQRSSSSSSSPTHPSVHSVHPTLTPSPVWRLHLPRSTRDSSSICFLHFCFSFAGLQWQCCTVIPTLVSLPPPPSHLMSYLVFRRESVVSRPLSWVRQPCYTQ